MVIATQPKRLAPTRGSQPAKPRITAASRRRIKLRAELWPTVSEETLWNRTKFTGFTTIPRTMPLILRIIDCLDRKSAGRVYFDLWCRAFDDYVVEVRDEYEAAFSSGYEGQRAIRSWRERIEVIERLGFVKSYKTPHGSYRYILLLDPHAVIDFLISENKISEESAVSFKARLINIGARDK